jgi:hypothetical protein
VLVEGVRSGHGGGGGCKWGGDAEAPLDGEAEEGWSAGYRSGHDGSEVWRRRRQWHVLRLWLPRTGVCSGLRGFGRREIRKFGTNKGVSMYSTSTSLKFVTHQFL